MKCEKWIREDYQQQDEANTLWWLNHLIGKTNNKEFPFDWSYPFVQERMFVITISAGIEGYHINVDGRHIASFPYRTV